MESPPAVIGGRRGEHPEAAGAFEVLRADRHSLVSTGESFQGGTSRQHLISFSGCGGPGAELSRKSSAIYRIGAEDGLFGGKTGEVNYGNNGLLREGGKLSAQSGGSTAKQVWWGVGAPKASLSFLHSFLPSWVVPG